MNLHELNTKERAIEHYRVQSDAAKWDCFGEQLQDALRGLLDDPDSDRARHDAVRVLDDVRRAGG